jgi:hypothetical protein
VRFFVEWQREMFEQHADFVSVELFEFGDCLAASLAEWALKVREFEDRDFCIGWPKRWSCWRACRCLWGWLARHRWLFFGDRGSTNGWSTWCWPGLYSPCFRLFGLRFGFIDGVGWCRAWTDFGLLYRAGILFEEGSNGEIGLVFSALKEQRYFATWRATLGDCTALTWSTCWTLFATCKGHFSDIGTTLQCDNRASIGVIAYCFGFATRPCFSGDSGWTFEKKGSGRAPLQNE